MQKATFTLRFVTPAFIAGADQQKPEIHVPSIRGALRYWLRAAVGGVYGTDDLKRIHQVEDEVFGSPDRGSPTSVRAGTISPPPFTGGWASGPQKTTSDKRLHWRDDDVKVDQDDWIEYILWTMAAKGDRQKSLPYRREYYKAEASFTLRTEILGYRLPEEIRTDDGVQHTLQKVNLAVWLLTHLGGIGARSRRGLGSMYGVPNLDASSQPPQFLFTLQPNVDALQKHLQKEIASIREYLWNDAMMRGLAPKQIGAPSQTPPPFDVMRKNDCHIWILQWSSGPVRSYAEAFTLIGSVLHDGRRGKANAEMREVSHESAFVFGLPQHEKATHKVSEQGHDGRSKSIERRSSPLHFHVHPLKDGDQHSGYVVVATLFESQFLRQGRHLVDPAFPEFGFIKDSFSEDFLEAIGISAVEVAL